MENEKTMRAKKKNPKEVILKTTIDTSFFNFLARSDHCSN